jgi:carboxypeptidase Q
MRRRHWVGWVLIAGLSVPFLAGAGEEKVRSPEVQRIVSAAHEGSRVMEHLDVLVNRIGPRLTGSDNLTNACEWTRDRFASFGIDSARLEQWGEFPVGFNRGPWFGHVVDPEPRSLEFVTMAWSAGTKGPLKAKAVLAPKDDKELDEAKAKGTLAGAWVVMPPPRPRPAGGGFGGRRQGGAGPRPVTPAKAEPPRPGAVNPATPTAQERAEAAFLRKLRRELETAKVAGIVGASQDELLVTSGAYRISWDKLPSVPTVTVLRKQYDEIVAWLKAGKPVTLEFDIRNFFKKGPIKLYNVIADIPGTDKPDEYVIVGGHIDSWDGATGTTDNGTGCATTLEAARILMKAGVKPKRTIRFMLWSGEEEGLLGSRAYVKAHPELMSRISAVLVHDGGTNYLSGIAGTDAMQKDFEKVFAPVKELDPTYPFEVRTVPGLVGGGGSDHSSFIAANVPGFFWGQRGGRANYQHTHHTQFDTYDAAIPEYQVHSSLVVALGAFRIADLDHLLSREKLRSERPAFRRRTLGVELDDLTVADVDDDSVGQKIGIKAGDVIVKIDGTKVGDRSDVTDSIRDGGPKQVVTILRNGKEIELKIDWEPAAPASPR